MYLDKLALMPVLLGVAAVAAAQGTVREAPLRDSEEYIAKARSQAQTAANSARARELLLRSMERQRFIPSTSIVLQHGGPNGDCLMQVRLDQSREGRLKMTVLSPLSMQGVASIDNGREWITYLPDENRVMVMPSPRLAAGDPRFRMSLAEKNYTMRLEQSADVAGRKTVAVVAQPKSSLMPARRFYLDEEKNFLLRLETQRGKERKVLMDTKAISFPTDLPDALFEVQALRSVKKVHYTAPTKMAGHRTERKQVSFSPVLPDNLPYGFAIQEPQMGGGVGGRFIAVRITDGLATATVYQWDGRRDEPWPFEPHKGDKEVKGIRMRMVGELPDAVLNRILDAFVKEAFRRINTSTETASAAGLLDKRQEMLGRGKGDTATPWRVEPVQPAVKIDPPF